MSLAKAGPHFKRINIFSLQFADIELPSFIGVDSGWADFFINDNMKIGESVKIKKITISLLFYLLLFIITNSDNEDNLVRNGDFNNQNEHWFNFNQDSGKGVINSDNNQLNVIIKNEGKNPHSIGIGQAGIKIEEHYVYKVSFDAMSDNIKRIRVIIQRNKSPWNMYSGEKYISVTDKLTTYSFSFTMRHHTDEDASLQFHVGGNEKGKIIIDNVKIEKSVIEELIIPKKYSKPIKDKIFRGIAFGSALEAPAEGAWGQVLQEEYFNLIKTKGFDHIRFPIRWETHTDANPPYTVDPYFFKRIDWAVSHTLSKGLYAIINMHHHTIFEKNPIGNNKNKFMAMWKQIAEYFKDYPDNLYFEIYNEPTAEMTPVWNEYYEKVYDIIRETNPKRKIIISIHEWGKISALSKMKLPEKIKKDENIYISFHFYDPMEFCFQGTPNIPGIDKMSGIRWQGTTAEKEKIIRQFDKVTKWASENNLKLWNGEFTAHSATSIREDVLKWIDFIARECEKRDIPWAYWDFSGDTSKIYDSNNKKFDDEIINALIPK